MNVQAYPSDGPKRHVFVPLVTPDQVLKRIPALQPLLLLNGLPVVFLPQSIASIPPGRLPAPIAHYRA